MGSTLVAVVVATTWASVARAQSGSTRPNGALFEGASAKPDNRKDLVFDVTLAEAYDDNLQAELAGSPGAPIYLARGFYTVLSPEVMFESHGRRLQIGIRAASNMRYYGDLHQMVVTNHSVGAGLTAQITRTTSVFVNQGISYAPAYLYGLFARIGVPAVGDVIAPATDYALNSERSWAYTTNASLSQRLTPRATLSFNSDVRYTDFMGHAAGFTNLLAHDAGGRFTYAVSRDIKLRFGYTYRDTNYSRVQQVSEHDLDTGIEYSRPLSRSRRATVGFGLGPTSANVPVPESESQQQKNRIGADAFVDYQMGRSWSARGTLRRGITYIETLPNPVFTNAVAVMTQGLLNPRTDLVVSAAYTTGELALAGTPAPFTTYTGDVRVRVAVSKLLATYVEYVYYFYTFSRNLLLPPDVPAGLTRNGVRIGLTLWAPVRDR